MSAGDWLAEAQAAFEAAGGYDAERRIADVLQVRLGRLRCAAPAALCVGHSCGLTWQPAIYC